MLNDMKMNDCVWGLTLIVTLKVNFLPFRLRCDSPRLYTALVCTVDCDICPTDATGTLKKKNSV